VIVGIEGSFFTRRWMAMGILGWLGLEGGCEHDPVPLTDENFKQEVLESELPVVVDCWSDGCQPCRVLVPTMRKLACKYDGKVKVTQLNVEAGPRSVLGLGVRATPTVLFIKGGKIVERVIGVRGQHYYEEVIETDLLELPAGQEQAEPN
jgi:thioredoxin 1